MDVEEECYRGGSATLTPHIHTQFAAAASAREQKHNFGPGLSDEPFSHAKAAAAAAAAATRCKGVGRGVAERRGRHAEKGGTTACNMAA